MFLAILHHSHWEPPNKNPFVMSIPFTWKTKELRVNEKQNQWRSITLLSGWKSQQHPVLNPASHSIWKGNPSVFHRARSARGVWKEKQKFQVHFALIWNEWDAKISSKQILLLLLRSDNFFIRKKDTISPFWQWDISIQLLMSLANVLTFLSSAWQGFPQACFAAVASVSLPSLLPLGLMYAVNTFQYVGADRCMQIIYTAERGILWFRQWGKINKCLFLQCFLKILFKGLWLVDTLCGQKHLHTRKWMSEPTPERIL